MEASLDAVVNRAIDDGRIVGATLLVHKDGRPIYEKAHGMADREAGRAMTLDTIFRFSSLTKPIVAATILALVDAGKLTLHDLVTRHLPDFRPKLPDGSQPEITIHHLLTHTSGLAGTPVLTPAEESAGANRWHLSVDEMMARLAGLPLLFVPGTQWNYGPSIDVLGVIAGKLVGGSLGDAIAQYVTGPLRMRDTQFSVSYPARLAAAYGDRKGNPERMGAKHNVASPWGSVVTYDPDRIFDAKAFQSGGGGAAGTGIDFMVLVEALRSGGGAILKPETVALGLSNQTPQLAQAVSPGMMFSYFGAFVDVPAAAGLPMARGANRWGGIYGHNWFIDPANGLVVVSMSNTGLEGSDGAYRTDVCNTVYAAL
ncbi:MAG: beta-lactamase family protein [Alphaproteobacteria bacterium]|nr:beta-lactamase family protein [Alphaproteobacteria bacterium]